MHGSQKLLSVTLLMGAFAVIQPTHAAPYLPVSGSTVVEHLPLKNDTRQRELQVLRKQLAADPKNVQAAAALARRYIAEARNDGDPRYLGYAQAALTPWWTLPTPPIDILVLRATLLQSTHQFPAALTDLDAVLRVDRGNAQAWITRATVLQVTGQYAQAKSSCLRLYPLAPELVTLTCLNNIRNLNGEAAQSYADLVAVLKKTPQASADLKIWVMTLLAEMAERRGDAPAAESWFKQALALDTPDTYLLGAYADFLLDQRRPAEVVPLVKDRLRVDALLLRFAIALHAQNLPSATEQIDALGQRFDAALMRGDTVHQREHARYELELKSHPTAALALALKNWAVQKEPADLRIYLQAALASKDKKAAQPAIDWLKLNKLEDNAIQKLVTQFGDAA